MFTTLAPAHNVKMVVLLAVCAATDSSDLPGGTQPWMWRGEIIRWVIRFRGLDFPIYFVSPETALHEATPP
jgi:hypothetical protein